MRAVTMLSNSQVYRPRVIDAAIIVCGLFPGHSPAQVTLTIIGRNHDVCCEDGQGTCSGLVAVLTKEFLLFPRRSEELPATF